ncbi:MAG: hypothetical protein EBS01_11115 [Verrucomicrobia bacterium]|nr:hypothetical protein [Verrucomicrobiota bacterium]
MEEIFFPMKDASPTLDDIKINGVPVFARDTSIGVDGVLTAKARRRISGTHHAPILKVYLETTPQLNALVQVTASRPCHTGPLSSRSPRATFPERLKAISSPRRKKARGNSRFNLWAILPLFDWDKPETPLFDFSSRVRAHERRAI